MRRLYYLLAAIAIIAAGSLIYTHFHDEGWRSFPGGGEIRAFTVTYGNEAHVKAGTSLLTPLRDWLGPRWGRFLGKGPVAGNVAFPQPGLVVWFVTRRISPKPATFLIGVQENLVLGDKQMRGTNFITVDNGGDQLLIGVMLDDVARTQPHLRIRWSKGERVSDCEIENPFFLPTKPIDSGSKASTPSAGQLGASMLSGQLVPGKPGFVTSPYASTMGYVDVRGYPSGTKVRCPYTQKDFLVP